MRWSAQNEIYDCYQCMDCKEFTEVPRACDIPDCLYCGDVPTEQEIVEAEKIAKTKQKYYVVMETTATVEANSEEEAIQIAKKGEDSNGVELGYHIVDKVTKIRKVN